MDEKPVLFFDVNCPFCEQLAHFTARRFNGALRIQGWERSDTIGLKYDGVLHTDVSAWVKLLELDPHLRSLSWLAAKIGLQRLAAGHLMLMSRAWRRICRGCGRR